MSAKFVAFIKPTRQVVEGNLKSVWETLTRTPVDLTWT